MVVIGYLASRAGQSNRADGSGEAGPKNWVSRALNDPEAQPHLI